MQTVTTIGLDIAKSVFQVHGVDSTGHVVIRRQLKRRAVLAFFQKLLPPKSPPAIGVPRVNRRDLREARAPTRFASFAICNVNQPSPQHRSITFIPELMPTAASTVAGLGHSASHQPAAGISVTFKKARELRHCATRPCLGICILGSSWPSHGPYRSLAAVSHGWTGVCSLSTYHREAEICVFFNNPVYFRVASPLVAPIRNCGGSVNRCFRSCILLRGVSGVIGRP